MMTSITALLLAALAPAAGAQAAEAQGPSPAAAPDYADEANWLCLPGRADACAVDLTATVVEADGSTEEMAFEAAEDPAADCFYVYPTVSTDPTPNSDLSIDEAERRVAAAQAARFAEACRVYAPMYRQVTLSALRSIMTGQESGADGEMAYRDVADAFSHYLENENEGRPFVLIGHSQGTRMLTQLVANEIDGQPLQDRMLSAMLIGFNVGVPEGETVGGTFENVPLCEEASQTGCAISFVTFKSNAPPPASTRFGRSDDEALDVACVDPAALLGKDELDAYLGARTFTSAGRQPQPWVEGAEVDTDWVKVPGLLTAQCKSEDGAQYLSLDVNADPSDPRTDDIGGEVQVMGRVLPDWGLHLIDVNVVQGDLIELVRRQSDAYHGAAD
ncbi:DUF3089 domain-containing protein [Parvularcula oceani]|uniref:DUF3089 domain-containing protein n=1 Tax=Parvularcula oceani TaxID=1247963 RepID=UPI0004E21533|nr:DUF3089 domain-containing protein [Parvularcula oceani]